MCLAGQGFSRQGKSNEKEVKRKIRKKAAHVQQKEENTER